MAQFTAVNTIEIIYMKFALKVTALVLSTLLASSAFAADTVKAPSMPVSVKSTPVDLSSSENKLSYVMGLNAGMNLKSHGVQIDPAIFLQGMQVAFNGTAPAMTPAQIDETLKSFQKHMQEKQQTMMKEMAVKNKEAGAAFMKTYESQKDVKALGNGVFYKVLKVGTGPVPKATDTVKVTYEGKLVDGKVFDSTNKAGKNTPVPLPIAQLIPGMQKALTTMTVGSTWEVAIPSAQGYGEKGVGPIQPNETLVFNISVDSIVPATK